MFFAGERRKGKLANLRRKKFFLTLTLSLSLSLSLSDTHAHTQTNIATHSLFHPSHILTLSSLWHTLSLSSSLWHSLSLSLSLTLSLFLTFKVRWTFPRSFLTEKTSFTIQIKLLLPFSIAFRPFERRERERKKEGKKIWDKSRRSTSTMVVVARAEERRHSARASRVRIPKLTWLFFGSELLPIYSCWVSGFF